MAILKFHFHRAPSIAARLIRWRTGSDINHNHIEFNGIHYDIDWGRRLVKIPNRNAQYITSTVSFEFNNPIVEKRIQDYLDSTVNAKYDKLAIFGFIINKNKQNVKRLYCSEHGDVILDMILDNPLSVSKKLISPHSLRDRVMYFAAGLKQDWDWQSYDLQAYVFRRL